MRTHSRITTGVVSFCASLAVALAAPLAAQAGPLLSGYGGPGQGNQAILGSTLIGGSGGGSGGGSTGSGGGPEAAVSPSATSGAGAVGAGPGATRAGGPRRTSDRSALRASGAGSGATRAQQPLGGELGERSYRGVETAGDSSALGLSGADVAYIVLAAAALAFTGLFTRRLAGTRAAKGHS
jgi:hypothetical protein